MPPGSGSSPPPPRSPEQQPVAGPRGEPMGTLISWVGTGEKPGAVRAEHLGDRLEVLRTDEQTREQATAVLSLAGIGRHGRVQDIDPDKVNLQTLDLMHAIWAAVRSKWPDLSPERTPENLIRSWLAGAAENPDDTGSARLPAPQKQYLQNLKAAVDEGRVNHAEADALLESIARPVAESIRNPREGMRHPVFRTTETVLREYLQAAKGERGNAPRDYILSVAAALGTVRFVIFQTAERKWGKWGVHRRGATSGEARVGTVVSVVALAGAVAFAGYRLWAAYKGIDTSGGAMAEGLPDGAGSGSQGATPSTVPSPSPSLGAGISPAPTEPAPLGGPGTPLPVPVDVHHITKGETLGEIVRDELRKAGMDINDRNIKEVRGWIAGPNRITNIHFIRAGDTLDMTSAHKWMQANGGKVPGPAQLAPITEHVREQWGHVTDVSGLTQRIDTHPPQPGEGLVGYLERVSGIESTGVSADLARTLATDSRLAESRHALTSGGSPMAYAYDGELRLRIGDFTPQQAAQFANAVARAAQWHQAELLRQLVEDYDAAA